MNLKKTKEKKTQHTSCCVRHLLSCVYVSYAFGYKNSIKSEIGPSKMLQVQHQVWLHSTFLFVFFSSFYLFIKHTKWNILFMNFSGQAGIGLWETRYITGCTPLRLKDFSFGFFLFATLASTDFPFSFISIS